MRDGVARRSIAAVVLVGLLAACSSQQAEPASDLMRYDSNGVTFDYPKSWVDKGELYLEGQAMWEFTAGPTGQANGYVEVLAFETAGDLTTDDLAPFGRFFFGFFQSDAMGDRPDGEVEESSVAGVPALEQRWSAPNGASKRAVVFFSDDRAYAIGCFVPAGAEAVDDGCEGVIRSFRLLAGG